MADAAEWEGQVALVTGAGGAIGRATTAGLLAGGASVVAFDAAAEPLEAARAEWAAGERVQPVVGDVGEADAVAAAFAAAERTGRPLGALVTCAAIYTQASVEELTDEQWRRLLRVNLRGTFLCCRAAARAMIPRRAGAIVTMSSGLGFTGGLLRAHYAASKAGVAAFTKSLALELAPHGIRANALAPGALDTPMPRQLPGRTEEDIQRTLRRNPLGRVGGAQDAADLILFLLSGRSSHITGQVIHINGGELMP
jgi:NAD(P)-dependent dehydrogenase (short-subunit alcohol dehydrogenase family)